MKKKIAVLAVMSLSAGVVLAGCQSIQDQMGSKLAEGIINSATNGEVKVNLADVKNGKMTLQTKDGTVQLAGDGTNGGTVNITDASGKTQTLKGNSGDTRVEDAPVDMPSLENGTGFSFLSYGGLTSLNFNVPDKDFKTVCQKEMSKLEGVGWAVDDTSIALDTSDGVMKSYLKGIETLVLTCGTDGEQTTIALQKTLKASS
jgi:hypothetical protein